MSKSFALAAFNTAVVVTNAGHAAKRLTPEDIAASKPSTKRNVRTVAKRSAMTALIFTLCCVLGTAIYVNL